MHQAFETQWTKSLLAPTPPSTSKRFSVYRNNVFVSLVEALKTRFPAVQNAVGAEFFAALARDYAGSHLPTSPLMMAYGNSFPDYIDTFPPLAAYPWLGDLARLERAMTESYHAADALPVGPDEFDKITPDQLVDLKLELHPAIRIVPSAYPVATLWQMNTGHLDPASIDLELSETAFVSRPEWMVAVKAISAAGGVFFSDLWRGVPLGQAVSSAIALDPHFDLTSHLHLLITEGLVTRLSFGTTNRIGS